ncbi:MAG: hypothetical protein ACRENU_02200 [Gemmatimonadaceae bacterium]
MAIRARGAAAAGSRAALALALWSCGGGEQTAPAPDPAISIALSQPSIAITQGQQGAATLTITRTSFTGPVTLGSNGAMAGLTIVPTPASVTGNTAGIAVTAAGFTEPGTVSVAITASGSGIASRTTTLSVTVSRGPLNASTSEPLHVGPGLVWRFRGNQALSLSARVDGQTAAVTYEGDSVALVAVPNLAAFVPCMGLDTLPVFLATATGSVHLDVAAEAPLKPGLAVGARRSLDTALVRGCRAELPAGKFALVAAVPDVEAFVVAGQLRADSAQVLLDIGATEGAVEPLSIRSRARTEFVSPEVGVTTSSTLWHDRLLTLPIGATVSAVGCSLLSALGDSILIPTRRDNLGRFRWSGAGDPAEWWHLIARTPNVDVVVDTGGRRIWNADAFMRTNVGQVLALYDTAFVPVWTDLYATPLPDRDANSRMIWFAPWNSGEGGGGGTGWYLQSGCTDNERAGEAFYAPLDMFSADPVRTPPYLAAYFRETVFHEASHTHDLARRAAAHGRWDQWPPGTQVAAEGIPVFVTEYWNLKRSGAALTGNHSAVTPSTDGIDHPGLLWEVFPRLAGNYHWNTWADNGGYKQSGRMVLWMVAQAVRQGRPLSSVLTALATAPRATYGAIYRAGTGVPLSDRDVLVTWVLSAYADDRVPGIEALINYTPWNTANAYASRQLAFPLPTSSITGAGAWSVALGDPDAKVIEVTLNAPMHARIRATGSLGTRVVLELLRVQ